MLSKTSKGVIPKVGICTAVSKYNYFMSKLNFLDKCYEDINL